MSDSDWRRNGQEKYLTNAELIFIEEFRSLSDKWEHEHCEFCWEKFSEGDNDLHSGYCTADQKHWICPDCFEDFREEFQWTISDTKIPDRKE